MSTMSIDDVLQKIQDLKAESAEKDQVIDEQQRQIGELEARCRELEEKAQSLSESATRADELMEKLTSVLG